jgi:purine-nucleoside phosphorylase
MSTTHNEAKNGEIAKTVLMPGDPLRAKYIAEEFLDDCVQFNSIRHMLGYTGSYKGKRISVMGSGMGMPSIGIYSYELFSFYNVESIIRIGSAGAYDKELSLYDLVLAESAWSESTYGQVQNGSMRSVLKSDLILNNGIQKVAKNFGYPIIKGCVHSSDVFYLESEVDHFKEILTKQHCICVDMESFALFHNAKVTRKRATSLLTISNNIVTKEEMSPIERERSFLEMIEISLETGIN